MCVGVYPAGMCVPMCIRWPDEAYNCVRSTFSENTYDVCVNE